MRPKFVAVTAAAVAAISGCGVTQASVIRPAAIRPSTSAVAHPAKENPVRTQSAKTYPATASPSPSASSASDPSLDWLESAGGQEQVTFNDDVSTMAGDLETESQSPTVANHLTFETDARVMRAEAEKILSTPSLLPKVNRAAYEKMLNDFIIVANLLQPGPDYGTTAQDWTAWNTALAASNIIVY
jgi:hypothetical protein